MRATARKLGLPLIGADARSARHHPRHVSLPLRRLYAAERATFVDYPEDVERPRTRGDCLEGPRPCPFVACRYHLYVDINRSGSLRVNFPATDPSEHSPSCALDLADAGELALEYVAFAMNLTRERVRQLERVALRKLANVKGWPDES